MWPTLIMRSSLRRELRWPLRLALGGGAAAGVTGTAVLWPGDTQCSTAVAAPRAQYSFLDRTAGHMLTKSRTSAVRTSAVKTTSGWSFEEVVGGDGRADAHYDESNPALAVAAAVRRLLPERIILVRHGESEANVAGGHTLLRHKPDNMIELTEKGSEQAQVRGTRWRASMIPIARNRSMLSHSLHGPGCVARRSATGSRR